MKLRQTRDLFAMSTLCAVFLYIPGR